MSASPEEIAADVGRQGYAVVPGFLSEADCTALMARARALVDGYDPGDRRTVFSTRSAAHARDDYFLGSGDEVRFFWEEDAFDADDGRLSRPKALAINKIGHALHDLDPEFERVSRDPRLAAISRAMGLSRPLLLQSMYIFKQPGIGGEVAWHQDATFLYTDPISVTGFWFALEEATINNGCLWVLDGGHRGPLRQRFRRTAEGLCSDVLDDTPLPLEEATPLPVPAGTLVVLHGLLPHFSRANRTSSSRHAYALHVIDGTTHYRDDNWLQRGFDKPLRGF